MMSVFWCESGWLVLPRSGVGEEEGGDEESRSGGGDGVSKFGGVGFEGLWDVPGEMSRESHLNEAGA